LHTIHLSTHEVMESRRHIGLLALLQLRKEKNAFLIEPKLSFECAKSVRRHLPRQIGRKQVFANEFGSKFFPRNKKNYFETADSITRRHPSCAHLWCSFSCNSRHQYVNTNVYVVMSVAWSSGNTKSSL
jgi:hypothetical protein